MRLTKGNATLMSLLLAGTSSKLMDLAPARSMITAQEYWSRDGMSLVLYGTVHCLKAFLLLLN